MGFFDSLFKKQPPALNTWVVSKNDDGSWTGFSIDDGFGHQQTMPGLGPLAQSIATTVQQRYVDSDNVGSAELQYAIYPWGDMKDCQYMFDVTKSVAGYDARDIQGSDVAATAATLDEVVQKLAGKVASPETAMLRWVRPIHTLNS